MTSRPGASPLARAIGLSMAALIVVSVIPVASGGAGRVERQAAQAPARTRAALVDDPAVQLGGNRGPGSRRVNVRRAAAGPERAQARGKLPLLQRSGAREQSNSSGGSRIPQVVSGPAPVEATSVAGDPAAQPTAWDGLAREAGTATDSEPPDPWVAAGPDFVVQAVNRSLRMTNRNGGAATELSLEEFFLGDIQASGLSDPRVMFDKVNDRWIASEVSWDCFADPANGVDFGNGYVDFAISSSADPTADWTVWSFQYVDVLPDQPVIGTSSDKIVISSNSFGLDAICDAAPATYLGVRLLVVDWADVKAPPLNAFRALFVGGGNPPTPDTTYFSFRPAVQAPASTSTAFIVGQRDVSGDQRVTYFTLTGSVVADTLSGSGIIDLTESGQIGSLDVPPAPRHNGPRTIAIDERITDALWQQNRLTFISTYPCTPTGDSAARACVRVTQLNTTTATPARTQDMLIDQVAYDLFYGGIGLSTRGDLHVVYARSKSDTTIGSWATYQPAGATAGTITAPQQLAAGAAAYLGGSDNPARDARWGDYVGVGQDPQVPNAVWRGNQYAAADGTWATRVSQLTLPLQGTYVPVTPVRLLDTRVANGLSGSFTANIPRTFQVTGRGADPIPSNAMAVTGNLTVVGQTGAGYVSLGPQPTSLPTTSTINFPVGDVRANNVTTALGLGGTLSAVYKAATGKTVHLVFDVTGYFLPDDSGATLQTVSPSRILDTRSGIGLTGPFVGTVTRTFQVRGSGGVPVEATAVVGNLTVVGQTRGGFVTVSPEPLVGIPPTSTINFPLGDVRANGVTLKIGANGTIAAVYWAGSASTHLIFDVTGYYVPGTGGLRFVPLNPGRRMDTRVANTNLTGLTGKFVTGTARELVVADHLGVPAAAQAITGNLTVVGQTKAGFVTLTPAAPVGTPTTSSLNFPLGDVRANGVTIPLGGGSTFGFYRADGGTAGNTTHLILDVTGYFR